MTCGYSKYELYIIWKICYKNRWCNKHISKEDLCSGRRKHEINLYRDAVEKLVRNGLLKNYPAQGRLDVCIPKQNRGKAIEALEHHQSEYDFIRYIERIW